MTSTGILSGGCLPKRAGVAARGDLTRRLALLILALVVIRVALPLALLHPAWEFHRDELLYFAMGDHLELWRMQFPPFVPAIAAASKAIFGVSVWAARVPAALGGGALLLCMLSVVHALGGRTFALTLTAIASVASPVFVRASVLMQPVIFDLVWAQLALLGVVLACVRSNPRWWVLTGVAIGIGTLTKFSAPLYGILIGVTALVVPATRTHVRTQWPWIALAAALVVGSPSLVGQHLHHWPFFAQLKVLRAGQLTHVSAADYFGSQFQMLGAAAIPMAAGVWSALALFRRRSPLDERDEDAARARSALGFVLLFALLIIGWYFVMRGKPYYAAIAYPMLIAAGIVELEARISTRIHRTTERALQSVLMTAVTIGAIVLLPFGIPCFPPLTMVRYAAALGVGTTTNDGITLALPQDFADMLGWRSEADALARAWKTLAPEDRARATISGGNYGQVAALAMYGPARGLPYPVSTRSDFWAWGPGPHNGDPTLVALTADDYDGYRSIWSSLTELAFVRDSLRVVEERDVRIILLRGIRTPLAKLWQQRGPGWD